MQWLSQSTFGNPDETVRGPTDGPAASKREMSWLVSVEIE